jgi:hypothetical protein
MNDLGEILRCIPFCPGLLREWPRKVRCALNDVWMMMVIMMMVYHVIML